MKRFSDAAAEVTAVAARNRSPGPAPPRAEGEDARDPHACHAYGCPLPGAISASTVGGGPWFCRHHFGVGAALWPETTTRIRRELAHDGELVDTTQAVPPAVQRVREQVAQTRERRALAAPSREPGEDDE